MMKNAVPPKHEAGMEPLDDAVDHVRGGAVLVGVDDVRGSDHCGGH